MTVYLVLSCDHPGCGVVRSIHKPTAGWYTGPESSLWHVNKKHAPEWHTLEDAVFCPEHARVVIAIEKQVDSWSRRHHAHSSKHGELSGDAWAVKYPPPVVPEWLLKVTRHRLRSHVNPPTAKAVKKLELIEATDARAAEGS